jgi:hypothetical protein
MYKSFIIIYLNFNTFSVSRTREGSEYMNNKAFHFDMWYLLTLSGMF